MATWKWSCGERQCACAAAGLDYFCNCAKADATAKCSKCGAEMFTEERDRTNLEAVIEEADAAARDDEPKAAPVLPGQGRLFE